MAANYREVRRVRRVVANPINRGYFPFEIGGAFEILAKRT
jgi:hypothetical protein